MRVKQAVFLVGGRGTRLGALSASIPKPLHEIGPNARFLDLLLEQAARHGFTDIVLLAGHLAEQVEAIYHGARVRGARVRVVREASPLGTGGALQAARDLLDPEFIAANGDSFFDFNLRALTAKPLGDALGRVALRHVPDTSRYGAVTLNGERVDAFKEKTPGAGTGLINSGVYLLRRDILDQAPAPCSLETDIFPRVVAEGRLEGMAFDGYFLDIGLPETLAQAKRETAALFQRPAVIFDRDGVLNHDEGYTHRVEDLRWMPCAREAVKLLNDRGYYVFVASNQAGVARGLYDEAAVNAFHEHMQEELAEVGAHIDAFYYCPFHAEAAVPAYRHANHPDRKPNPGMVFRALSEWPAIAAASFLIGDRDSDLEAARSAGIEGALYPGGDLREFVAHILGDRATGHAHAEGAASPQ